MNELALSKDTPLYFEPSVLKKLHTYDDFLSTFIQLDQATTSFSWLKADLLSELIKRKGDSSVAAIAQDIKCPLSTMQNYIRTARAFPAEQRIENASFTLHYQASFADSYNPMTHRFEGEERFKWLAKAVDNNMSRRRLAELIKEDKLRTSTGKFSTCKICEVSDEHVGLFVIFCSSLKIKKEFYAHEPCFREAFGGVFEEN